MMLLHGDCGQEIVSFEAHITKCIIIEHIAVYTVVIFYIERRKRDLLQHLL